MTYMNKRKEVCPEDGKTFRKESSEDRTGVTLLREKSCGGRSWRGRGGEHSRDLDWGGGEQAHWETVHEGRDLRVSR